MTLAFLKTCIGITGKYTGAAYLGYKGYKFVKSRSQEKDSLESQPRPSRFSNLNSKGTRWKKKLADSKLVHLVLKPYVLGPLIGVLSVLICENVIGPLIYKNVIGPLISAYQAQNLLDECFDEKFMEKYIAKSLSQRLKEDDWPTNFAKLPKEMELEEKAQLCGLLNEDVYTLDATASRVHFILSCILLLSDLDKGQYESLLNHLARLLRAGKLSRKLRKYILMLLLRRGYRLPSAIYLLLKS